MSLPLESHDRREDSSLHESPFWDSRLRWFVLGGQGMKHPHYYDFVGKKWLGGGIRRPRISPILAGLGRSWYHEGNPIAGSRLELLPAHWGRWRPPYPINPVYTFIAQLVVRMTKTHWPRYLLSPTSPPTPTDTSPPHPLLQRPSPSIDVLFHLPFQCTFYLLPSFFVCSSDFQITSILACIKQRFFTFLLILFQ